MDGPPNWPLDQCKHLQAARLSNMDHPANSPSWPIYLTSAHGTVVLHL